MLNHSPWTRSYSEHVIPWQITEIREAKPNNLSTFKSSAHIIYINMPLVKVTLNISEAYAPTLREVHQSHMTKLMKVSFYYREGEKS